MKKLAIGIAAALLVWLLGTVLVRHPWRSAPRAPAVAPAPEAPQLRAAPSGAENAPAAGAADRYTPLDQLGDPAATIQADLKILGDLFFHYQALVKDPTGNPIGDNAEIVRALQGANRVHAEFLPARHPALSEQGELLDRWGTPFFFHALSGRSMEIRSAGPDRAMWTADDAVFPQERNPVPPAAAAPGGPSS